MLAGGTPGNHVRFDTPDGSTWCLAIADARIDSGQAACAVRKDSGDDPDATDGALIWATVTRQESGVTIDGGAGIGRVTEVGLDQPVGAAAINSVPRQMIEQAVRRAALAAGAEGGWHVVISCPTGERIAAQTFNPRLGIVGGISILGTTGIVEPMSNAALVDTMARQIAMVAARGVRDLLVVIGNYGESFARDNLGLTSEDALMGGQGALTGSPGAKTGAGPGRYGVVKSSNFIGDALNQAVEHGFERILLVGHIGKLAKAGIGLLNTHSSVGDGRLETLAACALEAGATGAQARRVLDCVSTDAALAALTRDGLLDPAMAALTRRIQATFERHVPPGVDVEWVCFRRANGTLTPVACSGRATALVDRWRHS
jgi:cobalt-precorrin-5B (C1)-methyltransferase